MNDSRPDQNVLASRLRITEIFCSLQGESRSMGWPTTFIRLTGCPLRCGYCDTSYAFKGGEWLSLAEILQRVDGIGVQHVTVTGGEPLAQKASLELLTLLCDRDYLVSLETSGALDISAVDPRVARVIDIKTPGSQEQQSNLWDNLHHLKPSDQLKFVICGRDDYLWSKQLLERHQLQHLCEVLFSPAYGELQPVELANWIVADRLPVRFQIQLHKLLWGEKQGV
ncbi:MAG: 7-carboxy-7-deazaguanine synthase QueE [Pseudomonadota bacterium]